MKPVTYISSPFSWQHAAFSIFKPFLVAVFFLFSVSVAYPQASSLSFNDTRNVNYPPDSFRFETRFDFKFRNVLGVPGGGDYSGLMSIAPWSDASGENVHQLNFNNGGMFYRQGTMGSGWQSWAKVLMGAGEQTLNGWMIVRTDHDAPLTLHNTESNSWQYLQFIGADNSRKAYLGITPGNDFHLVCESGNMILGGGNVGIGVPDALNKLTLPNDRYIGWKSPSGQTEDVGIKTNSLNDLTFYVNGSDRLYIKGGTGNVGIGTTEPGTYRLAVEGTIGARKVVVKQGAWADHVFAEGYALPSLYQLEQFVITNKHLPGVPSEREVLTTGLDLGEMNKILLQKVEELTLYLIDHKKEIDALKTDNKMMRAELERVQTISK